MELILEQKCDGTAVRMYENYFMTKQGKHNMRHSNVGWSFHIKWKNGSTEWVVIKYLKETNPVDVAEYDTARGIEKEPLLVWWVPYTLRKRDVIVSEVSLRVRKYSHKYGIDIPTSIAHAKRLDGNNGNIYWTDATTK